MIFFGIEIEFIVKPENLNDLNTLLQKYNSYLLHNYNMDQGGSFPLFKDGSIAPEECNKYPESLFYYGFQIKTIPLKYNESNIQLIKNILDDLSLYVFANYSCSIHVHVSKQGCDILDHYTILYQYLKQGYANKFKKLNQYDMTNYIYANLTQCKKDYYYRINSCIRKHKPCIINIDTQQDKTDLYKINLNYNTIQYRGLRHHFCNEATNTEIIEGINRFLVVINNIQPDKELKKVFKIINNE